MRGVGFDGTYSQIISMEGDMSTDKADYENREQAWVKHWLLEKYLERLILKVGTRWNRFIYVDAFAGPWGSTSNDLSDTSFSRALHVLKKCQEKILSSGRMLPMQAIFLEKNKSSAKRLIEYSSNKSTDKLHVIARHADFLDEISSISESIRDDDFVFVLVDPTGYKDVVTPKVLAPLLKKRGVEVLINLMWDHINRFWSLPETEPVLDAIFGCNRDKRNYEDGGLSEQERCNLYTARLRETAAASRSRLWASAFPVMNPKKERTHYYLVYTTHSPIGLLTFDEIAESTWQEQTDIRATVQVKNKLPAGQGSLFCADIKGIPVERIVDKSRIREAWLNLVPTVNSEIVVNEIVMAKLLEDCTCLACDLQEVLGSLISSGLIQNNSATRPRPKNAVHWKKKESIRRIS